MSIIIIMAHKNYQRKEKTYHLKGAHTQLVSFDCLFLVVKNYWK